MQHFLGHINVGPLWLINDICTTLYARNSIWYYDYNRQLAGNLRVNISIF